MNGEGFARRQRQLEITDAKPVDQELAELPGDGGDALRLLVERASAGVNKLGYSWRSMVAQEPDGVTMTSASWKALKKCFATVRASSR